MNQVTFFCVYQDVSIVPVLDLQNVGYDAVCCLRSDKVLSCLLEANVVIGTKVRNEKFIQTLFVCLTNWVSRNSLWNHFDDTSNVKWLSSSVTDCLVRKEFKLQIVSLKNLGEQLNNLKGETILSYIIKNLKDAWYVLNLSIICVILPMHFRIIFYFGFWFIHVSFYRNLGTTVVTEIHFYVVKRKLIILVF